MFETHRKVIGTSTKPKSDTQIIKWLNESSSSSSSASSSDKEYSLSDNFGTGGNTVSDKFSANANETCKLIVGGNDITAYVGGLSWQNSIDELATKMSFEVAK